MSSINNDVFQVIVGNLKTYNSGDTVEDLSNGEFSVFNALTDEEVDLGDDIPAKIFLAGKGDVDNRITLSPQFEIDLKKIKSISGKKYNAGTAPVYTLKGFEADVTEKEIENGKIDTLYAIKVNVENKRLMKIFNQNSWTKTYFSENVCFNLTAPTTGTSPTIFYTYDASTTSFVLKTGADLVAAYNAYKKYAAILSLYLAMKKDTKKDYFEVSLSGTSTITLSGDFHEDVEQLYSNSAELVFTGIDIVKNLSSNPVNMHYYKDRFSTLNISLSVGFCCGAYIENTTAAVDSVGDGYDVMQREYRAGGWNGKPGPYRTYAVTGMPKDEIIYNASANGTYNLFSITYEIEREAGWRKYTSWVTIEIAMPENTSSSVYSTQKGYFSAIADAAGITMIGD